MIIKNNLLFILFTVFIFVSGCMGTMHKPAASINPAEKLLDSSLAAQETEVIATNGSIWKDDSPLGELFINPKAKKVGDIVTVQIIESSNASNQAATKTGRKSSFAAGLEKFFNLEKDFPGTDSFFNPFSGVAGNLESDFDGSGSTKRSGKLTAYIATRVVQVLPNGNLKINGTKEVTVNNDKQLIKLTGIVRPRDISSENIVVSTYISEVKIDYSGSGIIDNRQRPGWLASILNIIWPF